MTDLEHKQVFFEFVKKHDQLNHLTYSEETIEGQRVLGIIVDDSTATNRADADYVPYYTPYMQPLLDNPDNVIIDPNWDNIYLNFTEIDHNLDSVEYIKSLVDSKDKLEISQIIIDLILKKLVACNINAKTVYVVVNSRWNTDWFDGIVGV
jgi:predicted RNA-binding protein YlqC (UPF0109 family)